MKAASALHASARWLPMTAVWLAIGLFQATQTVVVMRIQGMHHAWMALFFYQLLSWLPWAFATPWVMRGSRRTRLAWPGMTRAAAWARVVRHVMWALMICALVSAWSAALEHGLDPWSPDMPAPRWLPAWRNAFLGNLLASLILYAGIVITAAMLDSRERLAQQRIAAAQLAEQLSQAQLSALRHQIEPHFLFNTLNAIAGLVRSGQGDGAADMIACLSDFLRTLLRDTERQEVTLSEELDLARRYLDIQRMRYGERLRFHERVQDETDDALVPTLILQPLVENAVKHGIDRLAHGGAIELRAWRDGEQLCVTVRNDAPAPRRPAPPSPTTVGLANVRGRLQALYGPRACLDLCETDDGAGMLATLRMPWTARPNDRPEPSASRRAPGAPLREGAAGAARAGASAGEAVRA